MPLFDFLPPDQKNILVKEAIKVGSVIKLFCDFTKPPKDKRLIIISIDPLIGFFIVNSLVNKFIKFNPVLHESQIPILSDEFSFLDHSSFVACHEVLFKFQYEEVEKQIKTDYNRFLGRINESLRDKMVVVCSKSRTLTSVEISIVVSNLQKMEFS
jgi:hypothetical protein